MSPEQAMGKRDLDIRSDIYSLGATLYHMVIGKTPFTGGDSLEVMAKQVLESLDSAEVKNKNISRNLHYFIERMMAKDKNLRYFSPTELIDDIKSRVEGYKSLGEGKQDTPTQKPTTKKRWSITKRFKI
jgi:serine/threonine-protein kinase